MRTFPLTVFFLILSLCSYSQGTIKGKLMDSSSKKPLGLATISVFKAIDTTLITYRLSTPEGDFKVSGLPNDVACRAVISYSGYEAYRHEFTIVNGNTIELGTLYLIPSSKTLDEVLVIAERPPVTVKKDTIEFNASSFKTLPTALVEDLLKKLPGVQVETDGSVTVNGKRVNKILVDGKSFFGDDPKMATRNLPANVIDKIQVVDDKEEADRNTDGDLTNVGKVINLTFKKGVKKGMFGKAYAGAGTKERYEIGGIANIYRDTLQLSVLAFSNNINRSGFSMKDVQDLGGFNRSGVNSVMITRRSGSEGFALNGISFGGLDAGIARSTGAGFNMNHAPSKRSNFFLQYFFGNNHNDVEDLTNRQEFINDTTVTSRATTITEREVFAHTLNAGMTLKPDSLTDINFKASYSRNLNDGQTAANYNILNNRIGQLSIGTGSLLNEQDNSDYNHNLTFTRRSGTKKGRALNIFQNFTRRNNAQDNITESLNAFFYPIIDTTLFEQLRSQRLPNLSASISANWAEPLTKKWTLRFNNRYEYLRDEQEVNIYNKNGANDKYDVINQQQSTGFERLQNRFNSNLSLAYKLKQVNLTAGVSGLWQRIENEFRNSTQDIDRSLFNVLPTFSLTWKQLSVRYDENVTAPSIINLSPVIDSTNPFNIRKGNPALAPAKRSSLNVNWHNFNPKTNVNYSIYMNANRVNDDVVMARTINNKGIQTTEPINADGTWNAYSYLSFGKQYKNNQKFIFSYNIRHNFNYDRRPLIVNNNISKQVAYSFGPGLGFGLNWNDVVELRPEYRLNFNHTEYTDPYFKNLKVVTQYLENELIVRWPKKLVWETNIAYRYNSQVAPGLPKDNLLWNAALTLMMLKGDKGLLKLSVFDLLNRNNSFYRNATQNYIIDQQSNVLNRYAQLSFTYNIRNMGAPKKVGGRERLFMF